MVDLSNFKDSKMLVEIQERVCLERLAERFFQWLETQKKEDSAKSPNQPLSSETKSKMTQGK